MDKMHNQNGRQGPFWTDESQQIYHTCSHHPYGMFSILLSHCEMPVFPAKFNIKERTIENHLSFF